MRIEIDFDRSNRSPNTMALSRFLNDHLIGIDHGITFQAIFITLIEHPKKAQKFKKRFLYHKYADLTVPYTPTDPDYNKLNTFNFQTVFEIVLESLDSVDGIEVTNRDFKIALLKKDLEALRPQLPQTETELKQYSTNTKALDAQIHLKWMECQIEQRRNHKRELKKKVKEFRRYDLRESPAALPYLNMMIDLLHRNLKQHLLYTPLYSHIYFSIAETLEQAKIQFPLEDWYEYVYVAWDYTHFETLSPTARLHYTIQQLSGSLRELGTIDHVDHTALEGLLTAVQQDATPFLDPGNMATLEKELDFYLGVKRS